jgi:hypothetical protein
MVNQLNKYLLLLLFVSFSSLSHECAKWQYGLLYLSYNHDGDAKQQWEENGKIHNWVNGELVEIKYNDAKVSMSVYFSSKAKIEERLDNLNAIGNQGWELVSETLTPSNMATYYFKKCL